MQSEGSLQENGRLHLDGNCGNIMEDELTDLRRQVLFLQQQLEEREKLVQVLKWEINKTASLSTTMTVAVMNESGDSAETAESKKQCNAATQTGCDT